jgi:hypothetical protein
MSNIIKCLMAAFLVVSMSACTYTGAVRSGIAPTTVTDRTYKGNVSLLIDPAINTAEVTTSVGAHTVQVSAGSALNSAIVEAARIVFPNVAPQATTPGAATSDVIIKTRLQHIAASSNIETGFWSSRANITAQVSVVVEMLHRDGSIAYRQVVTGTGLESRQVSGPDKVREGVEVALERAIQQVADGTTGVLITGLPYFERK